MRGNSTSAAGNVVTSKIVSYPRYRCGTKSNGTASLPQSNRSCSTPDVQRRHRSVQQVERGGRGGKVATVYGEVAGKRGVPSHAKRAADERRPGHVEGDGGGDGGADADVAGSQEVTGGDGKSIEAETVPLVWIVNAAAPIPFSSHII